MKENTRTVQTLSVCLAATLDRHREKKEKIISVVFCGNGNILFRFTSLQLFVAQHTLGDSLVNPIGVGDTNKPICCNRLSTSMYVEAGVGGGVCVSFPLHWQCSVLAVGK